MLPVFTDTKSMQVFFMKPIFALQIQFLLIRANTQYENILLS